MRALKMSPEEFKKKQVEMKEKDEQDEKKGIKKVFKNKRARVSDDEDEMKGDAQPGSPTADKL